jgi:hypothetical protein
MEPTEGYVPVHEDDKLFVALQAGTQRRVRELQILKSNDVILIIGTCPSFYIKQMAQESIRKLLPEGYTMKNNITVKPE